MATVLTLPKRQGAEVLTAEQHIDYLATLLTTERGQGVVVGDPLNTEPKGRNRARNVAKVLAEGRTVTVADIPADDREVFDIDAKAKDDAEVSLPTVKSRTHCVPDGNGKFIPVLSLKDEDDATDE